MQWIHYIWWLLTLACVVWYATVTVYVAVRGAADIRHLLAKLDEGEAESPSTSV